MGSYAPSTEAWAKELEARTNGRIKVEISWGQALGRMEEYYDLAARGIADVTFVLLSFVGPDRFPMADIIGLPWSFKNAEVGGPAMNELSNRGYFDKEFADVKLCVICSGENDIIIFKDKQVTTLADIKGIKLGTQSLWHEERAKALDAVPVALGFPDMVMALQTGIVEGYITGFGPVNFLKLYELTKYVTVPKFGTVTVGVVMNKDYYSKLPPDIQGIVDGMKDEFALVFGKSSEADSQAGQKNFEAAGGQIVNWTPEALDEIDARFAPLWDKWITDNEAKGLPAQQAVNDLYKILQDQGIERPAYGYKPGS